MSFKKLSKTKLSVLIFSFSVLCLALAFFLSGLTWKQIVAAFSTKSPGSNLTSTDWNGLISDFVKKSGDTMTGPLTAPQINTPKIVTHQMCMGGTCENNWNNFVRKSGDSMSGSLNAPKINASQMCIGGVCKSRWPSSSHFGGIYVKSDSWGIYTGRGVIRCLKTNPLTGRCTCLSGYYSVNFCSHYAYISISGESTRVCSEAVTICYK